MSAYVRPYYPQVWRNVDLYHHVCVCQILLSPSMGECRLIMSAYVRSYYPQVWGNVDLYHHVCVCQTLLSPSMGECRLTSPYVCVCQTLLSPSIGECRLTSPYVCVCQILLSPSMGECKLISSCLRMSDPIIPICLSFRFYGGIHQAKFGTEMKHKNMYCLSGTEYCL